MSGAAAYATNLVFQALQKREDLDMDPEDGPEAGQKELSTSWALFILICLLSTALFTSYILQQRRIQAVHETVLSIFAGMIVGLVIRALPGTNIQSSVSFNYQFFFNLLLPPIILNSGYELRQGNFFRNIGTILTFAFAGTFMSALVLGLVLYLWTRVPFYNLSISFVEAISVGATLSATDPVTILSIFNTYKVDPKLYTIIFGESILNDAVAIVVFETAQRYRPGNAAAGSLTLLSLFEATGIFLLIFFSSLMIGVVVGMVTALGLKYTHVRRQPNIESCLIVLVAYGSYFFSNGVHMSGIVSLLFCGITLKHYAYYNMSRRTQLTTKYLFQVLAQLSENFIFIYLGLDLFTETNLHFTFSFILVCMLGICIARYMAVFSLSPLVNWVIRYRARRQGKDVPDQLPFAYQSMLYWAGLRGAVGVALAAGLEGENAPLLRATVLVVVVLTVIIFGGTTPRMLEILDIRTGVVDEVESDDEFDIEVMNHDGAYYRLAAGGDSSGPGRGSYDDPYAARFASAGDDEYEYDPAGAGAASRHSASAQRSAFPRKGGYGVPLKKHRAVASSLSPETRGPHNADDLGLELDTYADDEDDEGLPPAAPRRGFLAGGTSHQSLLHTAPASTAATPKHSSTGVAPPTLALPASSLSSQQQQQQQQQRPASATSFFTRHRIAGAKNVVRDFLTGQHGDMDRAAWFKQLDEDYIKPKLLLDGGSGSGNGAGSAGASGSAASTSPAGPASARTSRGGGGGSGSRPGSARGPGAV